MIFYVAVFVFYAGCNSIFAKVAIGVKSTVHENVPELQDFSNVRFIASGTGKAWKGD